MKTEMAAPTVSVMNKSGLRSKAANLSNKASVILAACAGVLLWRSSLFLQAVAASDKCAEQWAERRPTFQQIMWGRYLGRRSLQAEGAHSNLFGLCYMRLRFILLPNCNII